MGASTDLSPSFLIWGKIAGRDVADAIPINFTHGDIKDIVAGDGFYVVLTENGQIWSWGSNPDGCLGHGDETLAVAEPKMLVTEDFANGNALQNPFFVQISKGSRHMMALTKEGDVYVWGCNEKGQLGVGSVPIWKDTKQKGAGGNLGAEHAGGDAAIGVAESSGDEAARKGNHGGRRFTMLNKFAKVTSLRAFHKKSARPQQRMTQGGTTRQLISGIANLWRPKKITIGEPNDTVGTETIQVLAHRNSSFVVTGLGFVYSWGSNQHMVLHQSRVDAVQPSPVQDVSLNSYTCSTSGEPIQLYVVGLRVHGHNTIAAQVDTDLNRHQRKTRGAARPAAVAPAKSEASHLQDKVTEQDTDGINAMLSFDDDDNVDMPSEREMTLYESMHAMKQSLENVLQWYGELQAAKVPDSERSAYAGSTVVQVAGVTQTAEQRDERAYAAKHGSKSAFSAASDALGLTGQDPRKTGVTESDDADLMSLGIFALSEEQLGKQVELLDRVALNCLAEMHNLGGTGDPAKDLARTRTNSLNSPRMHHFGRSGGSPNTLLVLHLMANLVRLYKERCERLLATRQVVRAKRAIQKLEAQNLTLNRDTYESATKLQAHNQALEKIIEDMGDLDLNDALCLELATSVRESVQARILANETQIALVAEQSGAASASAVSVQDVALKVLQSVHKDLEKFSLWKIYTSEQGRKIFQSRRKTGDECFEQLVALADAKLDEAMLVLEGDKIVSRDFLLPSFCYDLLVESFRLRKLCNQYQMRVLLIHKGKELREDPEKLVPDEEAVFRGRDDPQKAQTGLTAMMNIFSPMG